MSRLRRPKLGDGEDDLVRMMEELKSGQSSINPGNIVRAGEKRKSDQVTSENRVNSECRDEVTLDQAVETMAVIRNDIIERIVDNGDGPISLPPDAVSSIAKTQYEQSASAFPTTFMVDSVGAGMESPGRGRTKKGRSLFARKIEGKSGSKNKTSDSEKPTIRNYSVWGETSRTLACATTGILSPDETRNIHRDNVEKIRSMTVEEITAVRNEILNSMSTESVDFLRAKVKRETSPISPGQDTEAVVLGHDNKVAALIGAREAVKDLSNSEIPSTYVNMERVEEEKMEWMKDLPQIHLDVGNTVEEKCIARFNFEGFPIPFNAEIPVHEGLHHHGDEPNRAGYTIDELLMLSRSTNIQQKVIAINTICKVILQYKRGYFDAGLLNQNIIDKLREHDFVLILRTSLDDTVESIRESALFCLRQLLDNQYDELILDKEYSSWFGHVQPSLPTDIIKDEERRKEFEKNRDHLKDFEVLQLDFVEGLIQMNVIQRLHFVLKSLQPTPSATKNAICIVRRIARHSLQSAARIAGHAGLLDAVFAKLKEPSSDALVCTEALKTARVISAWSRSLAHTVLSKDVDFAALISRNIGLQSGNAALAKESLRLWDTCLRYGLLTDLFTTLYPLIMKYYVALRAQIIEATEVSNVRYDVGALIIKVTEAYMNACVERTRELSNIMEMIMICIAAMLRNTFEKTDARVMEFLDSCITFINSFLLLQAKDSDAEVTEERANEVFDEIIARIFTSDLFNELIGRLRTHSALLSELKDGRRRDPQNIPSLGVVCEKGSIVPTIEDTSPCRILRSIFNLIHSVVILNKNLVRNKGQYLKDILCCNHDILSYVSAVCKGCKETLVSNWYTTDEHIMLLYYVLIRQEVGLDHVDIGGDMTWQLAYMLMGRLHMKHEVCIKVIFEKVICNFGESHVVHRFERLGGNVSILSHIEEIKNLYKRYFPKSHENWPFAHVNPERTSTLTQRGAGEQVLPSDWTYLPLLVICAANYKTAAGHPEELDKIETTRVILSLRMVFITLLVRGSERLAELDVAIQFSRLMTVFIASSSLFLELEVQNIVRLILIELFKDGMVPSFKGKRPIPGIDDMTDFYRQLVAQHAAVSYGDDLFSLVVLLPTGGRNGQLKDVLWLDNQDLLGAFKLTSHQLSAVGITIKSFIDSSEEASVDRIRAYASALITGRVDAKRQPALFSIAIGNITWARQSGIPELKGAVDPLLERLTLMGIQ